MTTTYKWLGGSAATSATLTLTLSDGDTAKLTFAGSYVAGDFGHVSDMNSGTLLKFV